MLLRMHRALMLLFLLFIHVVGTAWGQVPHLQDIEKRHGLAGISVVTHCAEAVSTEYHAGFRNIGLKLPTDSATAYRVASISKAAVALVTAKLLEQGHLDIDAPLDTYLTPSLSHPQYPEQPLTLRMLLSHTSGIRDGLGYSGFLSATYASAPDVPALAEALVPGGRHCTEDMWGPHPPGSYFHYSNLNFGVVATVLEAATGIRFDLLMGALLLDPYGLDGGFVRKDLDQPSNLATLYRQEAGQWVAQADGLNGAQSPGPNWEGYLPGTNAVGFAPQGGLRISARGLTALAQLWSKGSAQGPDGPLAFLGPQGRLLLQTPQWQFDGSNGDPYHGLFNQWSAGLHMASSGLGDDTVMPGLGAGPLLGHPGEAYGLISDAYATPDGNWSVAFVTNGKWDGYSAGSSSAFYALEEEVYAALTADFVRCRLRSTTSPVHPQWSAFGAPAEGDTTLRLMGTPKQGPVKADWHATGQPALLGLRCTPLEEGQWMLELPPLSAGIHRLDISSEAHPQPIHMLVWVGP